MPRIKWERYGRSGDWRGYSPRYGYVRIQHSRKTKKWYLVDDGYTMTLGEYDTKKDAQNAAEPEFAVPKDIIMRRAPNPGRSKRTARGRVRGRPLKNSAESDRKPMRAFVISGVRVEWFQGYAEDVRYLRASDGKKYSHVVETDAAELYLCSHPEFGNCLLIVDPSGRTPLWK